MKKFHVRVTADIPYPLAKEYWIDACSHPTAVSRGIRQFRKEDKLKRKHIQKIKVECEFFTIGKIGDD